MKACFLSTMTLLIYMLQMYKGGYVCMHVLCMFYTAFSSFSLNKIRDPLAIDFQISCK